MPRLVMIATQSFRWNRFDAEPGDRLEVSAGEMASLLYKRRARLATAADEPPPPPPPPDPEPIVAKPRRRVSKRTYKTREMRAERA